MKPTSADLWVIIVNQVPYYQVLFGTAVAFGIGEILLIVLAARRLREPSNARWPELIAAAGPMLVGLAVVASVNTSRNRLWQAFAEQDPVSRIQLVRACFEGQLIGLPIGIMLLVPILLLAAVAASLSASARLRLDPTRYVVPAGIYALLGLAPVFVGAWKYVLGIAKSIAAIAGVDPPFRALMAAKGMTEANDMYLLPGALIGVAGFICAFFVTCLLLRGSSRSDQRPRNAWIGSAACLVCASVIFLVARWVRAEVETPWPTVATGAVLQMTTVRTPDIDGPERLIPSPAVTVLPADVMVETETVNERDAELDLRRWRHNFYLLHPGEPINDRVVVLCAFDANIALVRRALGAAIRAEYRRAEFAFGKASFVERPLLGKVRRMRWTAATALLEDAEPDDGGDVVALSPSSYADCGRLARAVAEVRRSGKWPRLAL